ncbi:MAG: SelB C-terminal domain-containing protein, partial [Chloroflexi bacterium]|nr:SelB C-terminal domain-containing protein [Chloroflexota bacterium]
MEKNGELLSGAGYIISATRFAGWQRETEELLETAHKQNPLSRGVSRAELRVKLDLLEGVYGQLLESLVTAGKVSKDGEYIVLARFGAALSQQQDKLEQSILTLLEKNPQNPPSKGGLKINFPGGQTVIGQLIKRGTLIELPEDFILSGWRYTQIKEKVVSYLKENGQISVKDINTLFGFSRKYSIPLLTRLDRDRITRRQDNVRVLGP